jgi:pimeloyl-ACP methyl ester carboxylesterase
VGIGKHNMRNAIAALALSLSVSSASAQSQPPQTLERATGTSIGGSKWLADKPANWNGTLLLWSHGYWGALRDPENGPRSARETLLAAGYALVGSTYATPGWALAEAVPDQLAALDAFEARFGRPKRVLALGQSMGGLVTAALIERHGERFDGAYIDCASSAGSIAMMNMALDGGFAFVTLVAPNVGIRLVNTGDDRENGARVQTALAVAQKTSEGRARIALSGALAGLPGWTDSFSPKPATTDYAAQEAHMARSFVIGVFLPRGDQERRAGGVFSWNTGIDYRVQLAKSGRRAMVAALYREAKLDLDADLARLNEAPRISAIPAAADYMARNYAPTGRINTPFLILHAAGDGATSPSLARGYADLIRSAGRGRFIANLWTDEPGHCVTSAGEWMAGLAALEDRIRTGRWLLSPKVLNSRAKGYDDTKANFATFTPPPLLRPYRPK